MGKAEVVFGYLRCQMHVRKADDIVLVRPSTNGKTIILDSALVFGKWRPCGNNGFCVRLILE